MTRKPIITDELIAYLDEVFPDRLPEKPLGEFGFGELFGAAKVIRHLKRIRDEQRENMLTTQLIKGDN